LETADYLSLQKTYRKGGASSRAISKEKKIEQVDHFIHISSSHLSFFNPPSSPSQKGFGGLVRVKNRESPEGCSCLVPSHRVHLTPVHFPSSSSRVPLSREVSTCLSSVTAREHFEFFHLLFAKSIHFQKNPPVSLPVEKFLRLWGQRFDILQVAINAQKFGVIRSPHLQAKRKNGHINPHLYETSAALLALCRLIRQRLRGSKSRDDSGQVPVEYQVAEEESRLRQAQRANVCKVHPSSTGKLAFGVRRVAFVSTTLGSGLAALATLATVAHESQARQC
jgi:hypothetical protein